MKKIGKEVLMLPRSENNMRNGEGSFLRLRDGRILYAYTKYYGEGYDDSHEAYIAACYSSDEGETWVDGGVFFEKAEDDNNVMSVSFLRMQNGDLGFFYVQKKMIDGYLVCRPVFRRSSDEGKTFSEPLNIIESGYNVLINDRVTRLRSGRIILTTASYGNCTYKDDVHNLETPGTLEIYYSDDDGRSFKKSPCRLSPPIKNWVGLTESGIFELPDGRLWLYTRTGYGYQYQSFSSDGGITWTQIEPNYKLTSSSSPMLVRSVGKYTLAILNPMPWSGTFAIASVWGVTRDRTPFVMAIDLVGGESLVSPDFSNRCGEFMPFIKHCCYIEDDRNETYCYPSLIEVEDGILVAYYHSNGSGAELSSGKITKITFEELESVINPQA